MTGIPGGPVQKTPMTAMATEVAEAMLTSGISRVGTGLSTVLSLT